MKTKKRINFNNSKKILGLNLFVLIIVILLGLLINFSLISAQSYSRSLTGYTSSVGIERSFGDLGSYPAFNNQGGFDRSVCNMGQDFLLYISPTGCIPSVVRSDLLEKQNVPVFCPIISTQLNPLINVEAIDRISFRGQVPPEVSGVGYYPAQAALGKTGFQITNPLANNVGYAVIVLKQQRDESQMSSFVEGNLTATISYDIQNAFGLGHAGPFYLPVMNHEEWNDKFRLYSFWQGRGYLRADSVTDRGATISIYSGRDEHSSAQTDKRVLTSTNLDLETIKTSREIFMPGFDYCMGSLNLQLEGIENPGTTVRLSINGDFKELREGTRFLDNECQVTKIDKKGIIEKVEIRCRDDLKGLHSFELSITPQIILGIDGMEGNYSLGDKVFNYDQKSGVYIAYLSANGDPSKKENLEIALVKINLTQEKLSETDLRAFADYFKRVGENGLRNIGNDVGEIWTSYRLSFDTFSRHNLDSKDSFRIVSYPEIITNIFNEDEEKAFGRKVVLSDFGGVKNVDFREVFQEDGQTLSTFLEYYENAIGDYGSVLMNYFGEKYPEWDKDTLDQKALIEKIILANAANQKRTVLKLCNDLHEKYPNAYSPEICYEFNRLSSSEYGFNTVTIKGRSYLISIHGVNQPKFENFGAEISVIVPGRETTLTLKLTKGDRVFLNKLTGEYVELIDLDRDSMGKGIVRIETNLKMKNPETGAISGETRRTTNLLREGFPESYGGDYTFTIRKINLQRFAKVSIKSNIHKQSTEATFPFKIGIEKRLIQLSPQKTQERIDAWNARISQWSGINDNIGNIVKVGKGACYLTGTYLITKNFFGNLKGEGIARQIVMRDSGGWFEICESKVNLNEFNNLDQCLLHHSNTIDTSVTEIANQINRVNTLFREQIPECEGKTAFLGERVVNTQECLEKYLQQRRATLFNNLAQGNLENVMIENKNVPISSILGNMTNENLLITDARNIDLYSELLNSDIPELRKIANNSLTKSLTSFWVNAKKDIELNQVKNTLPQGLGNLGVDIYYSEDAKIRPYFGGKTVSSHGEIQSGINANVFVYNGISYTFKLVESAPGTDIYRVDQVYLTNEGTVLQDDSLKQKFANEFFFRFFDSDTYKKEYVNYEVKYYESGVYTGFPAIVPVDVNEGWYAAIKPVISSPGILGGGFQPYDDSGRVSNFYLCHVGSNGKEEFFRLMNFGGGIDDECRLINRGIGQPHDQFPGLSREEAQIRVGQAEQAFYDAQRQYSSNLKKGDEVTIRGTRVRVGDAAVGIPDIQCQDFMSPTDCLLLFNICDPVICPSSRCDLGGTYPVDNVIQTGIGGSIVLCLSNWPEVRVPICISGIHAGIDGLIQISEEYRDCLQISLETGQQVGICDQLHSIYMCEFFWKHSLPVARYTLPQLISSIFGRRVRGGGEYLGIQDAFSRASNSMTFFTQHYAVESFKAFKARSIEGVGTEICRNWISIPGFKDGKIFDALLAPDSPPQFLSWFDEIPYTSVTVPPMSHYKIFYHVYAGQDSPAAYEVYLKGDYTSLPLGVPDRKLVGRGFIETGGRSQETLDFIAPAGYKEVCMVVNNQEECGFKQVSTDFAVRYLSDRFAKDEASKRDIQKEAECISGNPNLLSLLNPNLQAGVGEVVDPAIYNRGIIRICSTSNPGLTTDPHIGAPNQRWVEVGYCDVPDIKCWLDRESVEDAIQITTLRDAALGEVSFENLDILRREKGLMTRAEFNELIKELETKSPSERIVLINGKFDNTFFSYEKGFLTLLRGNAFRDLALRILPNLPYKEEDSFKDETTFFTGEDTLEDGTTGITESLLIEEEYPIFNLPLSDISYTFFEGDWHFKFLTIMSPGYSEIKENWFRVKEGGSILKTNRERSFREFISGYPYVSENIKKFTLEELKDKPYFEGLVSLIRIILANKEGGIFRDMQLSTDSVQLSHKGVFKVDKWNEVIYFKFEERSPYINTPGFWTWSFDDKSYSNVDRFQTPNEPNPKNKELILSLKEKGFYEGSLIIFGIDASKDFLPLLDDKEPLSQKQKLLNVMDELNGTPAPGPTCFHSIENVYREAKIDWECFYADPLGKTYKVDILSNLVTIGAPAFEVSNRTFCKLTRDNPNLVDLTYDQKLDLIKPGDWLDIIWNKDESHAVIFVEWINKNTKEARIFDWITKDSPKTYSYSEIFLAENMHSVYMIRTPKT